VSRGRGGLQRRVVIALREAERPLGLDEVARAVHGERVVRRRRGQRLRDVAVPSGDLSNLRRALNGLVKDEMVERVASSGSTRGGRGRESFALSDRYTCNTPYEGAGVSPLIHLSNDEHDSLFKHDTPSRSLLVKLKAALHRYCTKYESGHGANVRTAARATTARTRKLRDAPPIRSNLISPNVIEPWERELLLPLVSDVIEFVFEGVDGEAKEQQ
jgi:hypothetical protein